jgi:sodium-independent organic anion transporter
MQRFADPKFYLFLFSIVSILGAFIFAYLTVVLSTIEKEFGLQSKEAAWVYSGNEISQIFLLVVLPLIGKVRRRPLWLGLANVVSAMGTLLIALPHFTARGSTFHLEKKSGEDFCDGTVEENCEDGEQAKDFFSMSIIFIGIFITGIGNSLFWTLGLPYIDDNSKKKDSPLRMSFAMAARVVGPSLGFMMGAALLKVYVNPNVDPGFDEDDPRWIGAWWIGFIIIALLTLFFGPWLTLFPGELPTAQSDDDVEKEVDVDPANIKEWAQEFKVVTKRLLTNRIYVLNLLSTLTVLFGVVGFFQFFPKYLEFQFQQRASTSGGIGGLGNIFISLIGIITSGFVMSKYKFKARTIAAFSALCMLLGAIAFTSVSFISCNPVQVYGLKTSYAEASPCTTSCGCENVEYYPVCSMDGLTQFSSPCHAGCASSNQSVELDKKGKPRTLYWDCKCAREKSEADGLAPVKPWWIEKHEDSDDDRPLVTASLPYSTNVAVEGYCPKDCSTALLSFFLIFGPVGVVMALARLPGFIMSLRAIEKRDKAASMTLTLSVLSLFALLPSPVVFGALIDSSCEIWSTKCGQTRNCLVYDTESMRKYLCTLVACAFAVTFLLDVSVWYCVKDLNIYDDDEDGKVNEEEAKKNKNF